VLVGDQALRFRRAVIATGSRAAIPPVPGIDAARYLTTNTLFSLTALPRTLAILGGGAIGCEMAQAFALLGTAVTLIEAEPRILPGEDPDASSILSRALQRDGVNVVTEARIRSVSAARAGISITLESETMTAEALLVAAGRVPAIDTLNLSAAGVRTESGALVVDDRLRTTNPRVFAAGDVCSRFQFTHAADAMARIVIQNALFFGRKSAAALVIPWCTYTFPEVAHVGAETSARSDASSEMLIVPFDEVDRAVVDGETEGFVRIRHRQGTILGATVVGPHAAELITFIAHVMRTRGSLGDLSAEIVPYPSAADALRKAGDAYRRRSLTPTVRAVLHRYFSLLRR
jgi:pyruvate/2-oxoglutarate dehydrogenase complex dihydrolipoamide dehydrogenase (E3) component